MRLFLLIVLPTMVTACASTSDQTVHHESVRHAIGWVKRQFQTCEEAECQLPTRKTLAMVELAPKARKQAETTQPDPPAIKEPTVQERIETRTVHFQFGKALPTPQGLKSILALSVTAKTAVRVELDGRTDDIGSKSFNDRLARLRAEHVRDWLLREGVKAPIALSAEGACCFADNDKTESARQRNRRVEVRLVHRVLGRDAVGNKQGEH